MKITAEQLANLLGGTLEGNGQVEIDHPAKIEAASNGAVAFLANMKYEDYLYNTNASVVLISEDLKLKKEVSPTLIRVEDPYRSFVDILSHYNKQLFAEQGVDDSAQVHPSVVLGENVYIGANCVIRQGVVIGDNTYIHPNSTIGKFAKIGADCQIFSNVSIYHYCEVGNHVIIHSGTVIGSDGFGFAPLPDGSYAKIPQVGNVVIGDHVEIGSNTSIDRATMGSTIIGNGVKIDNLVQIAHNVEINDHTVIAAQAGISGSTKIGKFVVVGGQAGFVGHITIADKTKINAQSGVSKSVKQEGTALSGSPAFDWREELKAKTIFKRLPELENRIDLLEKQIGKPKE